MSQQYLIAIILGFIVTVITFYLIIQSATKANKIEKHLSIQNKILFKIVEEKGIDITGIMQEQKEADSKVPFWAVKPEEEKK